MWNVSFPSEHKALKQNSCFNLMVSIQYVTVENFLNIFTHL